MTDSGLPSFPEDYARMARWREVEDLPLDELDRRYAAGGPSVGGDKHHVHLQSAPERVWVVAHGLGKRPSVSAVDSAGTEVIGDVAHLDDNSLTITHAAPFSGSAYLN